MGYLDLPVHSDVPCYQFQCDLENVTYTFDFEWNDRAGYWTMHISDENENPIIQGIRITTGIPLLDKFVVLGRPPGEIICYDTTASGVDPGAGDMGNRCLLIYRESTTPAGT